MDKNSERYFRTGIDVYNDNIKLDEELVQYTSVRKKNKFLDQYLKENNIVGKDLLNSHISYLKEEYGAPAKKRKYMFVILIAILCAVVAVVLNVNYIYNKFYKISIGNKTYREAVQYFYERDFSASSVRFKKLLENGFNGYAVHYYPSMISKELGNYDSSVAAIEHFIINHYGVSNITDYSNRAYMDLETIRTEETLSQEATVRVNELLHLASQYIEKYNEIDKYLYDENYLSAVHACEFLIQEGAKNYELTVAYVYSLVMMKEYATAYDYIIHYLETLPSYQEHLVTKERKITLLNFIMPFLQNDEYDKCYNYYK